MDVSKVKDMPLQPSAILLSVVTVAKDKKDACLKAVAVGRVESTDEPLTLASGQKSKTWSCQITKCVIVSTNSVIVEGTGVRLTLKLRDPMNLASTLWDEAGQHWLHFVCVS